MRRGTYLYYIFPFIFVHSCITEPLNHFQPPPGLEYIYINRHNAAIRAFVERATLLVHDGKKSNDIYIHIYIYEYLCVCVCVFLCVNILHAA